MKYLILLFIVIVLCGCSAEFKENPAVTGVRGLCVTYWNGDEYFWADIDRFPHRINLWFVKRIEFIDAVDLPKKQIRK